MSDLPTPPPAPPPRACWIRPDGTLLPVPDGLDAPIAEPGIPDRAAALARGWIGARPVPGEGGWEILPPVAAPTRLAHAAAGKLVRPAGRATPKPLAAALLRLALCAWESERYPDPATALARRGDGRASERLRKAVEAAAARSPGAVAEPDLDGVAAALDRLSGALDGLYEAAHGWRYGPALAPGPGGARSADPADVRAGAEAAAGHVLAAAGRLDEALDDARLAVYGLAPGSVPGGEPPGPLPGEDPLVALVRHADLREAEAGRLLSESGDGHLTDHLPEAVRPAARFWLDALNGTRAQVGSLREAAETYLNLSGRLDPADDRRRRDLANGLLAHECGRRALELRHRVRRTLPAYLDRLRQAAGSTPSPGGRP